MCGEDNNKRYTKYYYGNPPMVEDQKATHEKRSLNEYAADIYQPKLRSTHHCDMRSSGVEWREIVK